MSSSTEGPSSQDKRHLQLIAHDLCSFLLEQLPLQQRLPWHVGGCCPLQICQDAVQAIHVPGLGEDVSLQHSRHSLSSGR